MKAMRTMTALAFLVAAAFFWSGAGIPSSELPKDFPAGTLITVSTDAVGPAARIRFRRNRRLPFTFTRPAPERASI